MEKDLKFVAIQSMIDTGFWTALTRKKLDHWKLDQTEKPLYCSFQCGKNFVRIEYDAFDSGGGGGDMLCASVLNFNTFEEFKKLDKKVYLAEAVQELREVRDGTEGWKSPNKLFHPKIITFADLKKYHYYYWMCFPSFKLNKPIKIVSEEAVSDSVMFHLSTTSERFFALSADDKVLPFSAVEKLDSLDNVTICFRDHANVLSTPDGAVGVMARNIITLLWKKFQLSDRDLEIGLISIRSVFVEGKESFDKSKQFRIRIPFDVEETDGAGWELYKGKFACKKIDLSSSMDTKHLAAHAVDLNLKLMKWRLQPNIDLERLQSLKVLLLGSGTLGCNVARVLIGWGVRTITFVDSGTVSYSNPVRQSLFTFEDSVNKLDKASAAAASIQLIAPSVTATAVKLAIPMPGHHIPKDQADVAVAELEQLIQNHDVVYLLMDTRESRWLPTVIAKSQNKLVMNCALGFDTFMVMRHGVASDKPNEKKIIHRLGCYFCNDVVAPANSTVDRTLDQQCTVSRPGLSLIASAYAVELMVSLLQHEKGINAPAWLGTDDAEESCLGIVPHQIRGFLGQYHTILPTTQAFEQCTACSDIVLEKYKTDSNFLHEVFNSTSNFLEDLTGLSALHCTALELDVMELSDDELF